MQKVRKEEKKLGAWDTANSLQNVKNEAVHVTTVAKQRYVYRECCAEPRQTSRQRLAGMTAHSELKRF